MLNLTLQVQKQIVQPVASLNDLCRLGASLPLENRIGADVRNMLRLADQLPLADFQTKGNHREELM